MHARSLTAMPPGQAQRTPLQMPLSPLPEPGSGQSFTVLTMQREEDEHTQSATAVDSSGGESSDDDGALASPRGLAGRSRSSPRGGGTAFWGRAAAELDDAQAARAQALMSSLCANTDAVEAAVVAETDTPQPSQRNRASRGSARFIRAVTAATAAAQESKEQSRLPAAASAAVQHDSFAAAVVLPAQAHGAPSLTVRPATARRSAADAMRASTGFALRLAHAQAQARPSSAMHRGSGGSDSSHSAASAGHAANGAPPLSPRSAHGSLAEAQHAARLRDVAEREQRLDQTVDRDRAAVRANQAAQRELLERLTAEVDANAEIDLDFSAADQRLARERGKGSRGALPAQQQHQHPGASNLDALEARHQRTRDLSLAGLRPATASSSASGTSGGASDVASDTSASTLLRGVAGWLDARSLSALADETHLLDRAETHHLESEQVRADAARALAQGFVGPLSIPPPLRLELMCKLQATTARALVDREGAVETLKRALWKARYYLRDSVRLFETEISQLQTELHQARTENARLQELDVENRELLLKNAILNEENTLLRSELAAAREQGRELSEGVEALQTKVARLERGEQKQRRAQEAATATAAAATAQLASQLERGASLAAQLVAEKQRFAGEARGARLREAQLDAVNEMFRARREVQLRLREQKAREDEQARTRAEQEEQRREEEEEAAAAEAAAAAAGDNGDSNTFLTEPKHDDSGPSKPARALSASASASAAASAAAAAAASAAAAATAAVLSHYLSLNKKLYRLLQLHPENGPRRPAMLAELRGWILAAEQSYRGALARQVAHAEAAATATATAIESPTAAASAAPAAATTVAEGTGEDGAAQPTQPAQDCIDRAEVARLKLEQMRLIDRQKRHFRLLAPAPAAATATSSSSAIAGSGSSAAAAAEEIDAQLGLDDVATADDRAELARLEAEENEVLHALLCREQGTTASSEDEATEERARVFAEFRADRPEMDGADGAGEGGTGALGGGEAEPGAQMRLLLAEEAAFAAWDAAHLHGEDESRGAALVRALLRLDMDPDQARLDRRAERAQLREEKRARRAAWRARRAEESAGRAGPLGEGEDELRNDSHDRGRSPSAPGVRGTTSPGDRRHQRLPSYMLPTGRVRRRDSKSMTPGASLAPTPRSGSGMATPSPRGAGAGSRPGTSTSRSRKKGTAAHFTFEEHLGPVAAARRRSRPKSASGGQGDTLAPPSSSASASSSPRRGQQRQRPASAHTPSRAGGRRKKAARGRVANFVLSDDEEEGRASAPSSGSDSDGPRHGGEGHSRRKSNGDTRASPPDTAVASAAAAPGSFLPASYRSHASAAAAMPPGAGSGSGGGGAGWPGAEFFAAHSAPDDANFSARVRSAARALFDTWVAERLRREAEARRHAGTQCPDGVVSAEELRTLEHFVEAVAVEAAPLPPPPPPSSTNTTLTAGTRRNRVHSRSPSPPPGPDSPRAASHAPGRTVGVQAGVPPAFAHVGFYRLYVDTLLASLRVPTNGGSSSGAGAAPVRGPIEVSPCFSLYASLGADKDEGSEGGAVGALHALVPFDLSAALRAEEREDQQQGQMHPGSTQTEPAPFHPLGMIGSERVILSRVPGQVSGESPAPVAAGAAAGGDEEEEEARTDAALSAFIEDMDALPEPRSPSKGAVSAATKGAGRLFGDDLFRDAPPAPGATPSPRVYHPLQPPAEQRRQEAMAASVSLARRVELSRRIKEATLEHRKLTRAFLAGRLSRPPPSLESVLNRLGLGPGTDGDGASGGEGEEGSLLGPSMLPPTRAEIDATTGMSARFRSGPVLPSSTTMGAVLDSSAAAIVAHQHELDSNTSTGADGQGQGRERRHRPPVLHFAFQPVPFGKRALPMRAPTVFGPPDDIDELYRHLNARMGLPSGADASANAGTISSDSESAPPTAASTHPATDMSDSRWMDSVRARLWAVSDAVLRRRRQVQRAMVGPARERVVHELRGSVVGEHDDAVGAAGEQSAIAAKVKHARRPASAAAAGVSSSDADSADTSSRAMHKLELYAKMRREQQRHAHATQQARVAVQAQAQIRATASNVRASNAGAAESPRGQSSMLERLRAHDAVLRDAQMDAAQAQQQSVPGPGSNSAPIARSAAYMLVEFQRKQAALAAAAAEAMDAPVRLGSSGGAFASGLSRSALVPHPPSRSQPRPSSAVSSRTAHATVGSVMRTSQRSSGSARPPVQTQ